MHAAHFFGERLGEAEAGTEAHPDLPDPPDAAKPWRLVLAPVAQVVAVAAGENPAGRIQNRSTTAAVFAVAVPGDTCFAWLGCDARAPFQTSE